MSRTLLRTTAGALGIVLALASCGIDTQGSARQVPADKVPFGLLTRQPDTADPSTTGRPLTIYLLGNERLAPVERRVQASGLGAVTRVLGAGPTEEELALGLSSPLPPRQVDDTTSSRGVALVDLKPAFADLPSQDQSVAIAQLVFTLTEQAGIGRVSFTLDGQPVEVPRGDGALTTDPLVREDFPVLTPQP